MADKVAPTLPRRLCIQNEQGAFFTVHLSGSAVEPAWTPFKVHAYVYPDEAEAAEIALRFGGTVRPYDPPDDATPRGGVVVPFVRPERKRI